jgi:hypothetical protein
MRLMRAMHADRNYVAYLASSNKDDVQEAPSVEFRTSGLVS